MTRRLLTVGISLLILIIATGVALSFGAVNISFTDIVDVLIYNGDDRLSRSIILFVRLPRVLVTLLVGMNLSAAGVAVQAVFRNPMASPGIIGISSGASLGALICIVFGLHTINLYSIPLMASLFALISAFIVYRLASRDKRNHIIRLILVGIAISTLTRAIVQLILSVLEDQQIAQYVFWSMGSLADRRWEHVYMLLVPTLICQVFFIYKAHDLNMLLLSEDDAESTGFNSRRAKRQVLIISSIATALSVSVSGMITFVGLIVPHVMRLIVGNDNRKLMVASIVAGAVFLLFSDLIARTAIAPAELGVGIITSIIGAPILLYLVEKRLRSYI